MQPTSEGKRVLVCGGRDFDDVGLFDRAMRRVKAEHGPIAVIIHGGAKGADTMAERWAKRHGIATQVFDVKREEWRTKGRAAGPLRNQRMLDEGRPNLVVAFSGHRGTAHMVRISILANVQTIQVTSRYAPEGT